MSVEDLLRHPKIWRGQSRRRAEGALSTGFAELDAHLPDGGWPRKALTEIFVVRYGIGELSLLMPALAGLCRQDAGGSRLDPRLDRWIVWIAPPFIPHAPALARCGIDLDRVLVVHSKAQKKTLWAVEQSVRSSSAAATLAWLPEAGDTTLRRLQLGAEERDCWTVLFRPIEALGHRSPATLRLKLSPAGARTRVDLVKCRGARPRTFELDLRNPQR